MTTYDTIIIGGGIAGLQAAIQLARSLHKVLVIDKQTGRSAIAKNYRNMLGYPDGVSGEQLRETGREQAKQFGVEFFYGDATFCEQDGSGLFCVTIRHQDISFQAKTVLVATGIADHFRELPGLAPCLGESVYICPDCDGYEVKEKSTLIIGSGRSAVGMAKLVHYYTKQLTVINHTGTPINQAEIRELEQLGIGYCEEMVASVEQEKGRIRGVTLKSGKWIEAEAAFTAFSGAHVNTDLLQTFSIDLLPNGHVIVDPRTKETSHPNIWAAGDIVAHSQQVTIAMGDGSQAAIWIHKRLLGLTEPKQSFHAYAK